MDNGAYWTRFQRLQIRRRRLLGAGLAGGAALSLLGCASGKKSGTSSSQSSTSGAAASAGTPQLGGTFNTSITYNPPLDPQKVSAAAQVGIGGVYSRIFRFQTSTDPNEALNHDLENDLGISAESPDAITWTIKLRPDAKFHNIAPVNGHAVEAEDVKATFARALSPSIPNPNAGGLDMIDPAQIQTPDKQTVVFKLNYTYSPFRTLLANPSYCWIMPREALAGSYDPGKVAIGSGPFLLDSVTPDVAYTYKKNPNWFQKGQPYVDTVHMAIIADHSALLAQFLAGNLDTMAPLATDLDTLRSQTPKALLPGALGGGPEPIYFQMGDPTCAFQDIRARRAVSMAIDRDAIAKAIVQAPVQYIVYVPGSVGKWALKVSDLPADSQQYYKYDPANAKKLLAAAGIGNQQFVLVYITNSPFTTPAYVQRSETVASMLNAAGIKTAIGTNDYNKDFVDSGKGSRQGYFDKQTLLFGESGGFSDPDDWLFSYFDSKSTSNQEHLNDPAYDAMITKERSATTEADRLKVVLDIQKYIAQQMYAPSTGGLTAGWLAVQPRVQNYCSASSNGVFTETYAKLWLKS